MIERQLLWYKSSEDCPEIHHWYFLAINEKREILQIKQKLHDNLGYIVEESIIDNGKVGGSDLFYEIFCIDATKPELDFFDIYNGKVRKDRVLQPRKSPGGWNNLINKVASGEFS
jgi:hypothetical protein